MFKSYCVCVFRSSCVLRVVATGCLFVRCVLLLRVAACACVGSLCPSFLIRSCVFAVCSQFGLIRVCVVGAS